MNGRAVVWTAVAVLLAPGAAWAHHSATQYDRTTRLVLTGTLVEVDWTNPHVEFLLDVRAEDGRVETWRIESAPPNRFAARDIGKSTFLDAIGQTVTTAVSPERGGARSGILLTITFADGRVLDCGDRGVSGNCTLESPPVPR